MKLLLFKNIIKAIPHLFWHFVENIFLEKSITSTHLLLYLSIQIVSQDVSYFLTFDRYNDNQSHYTTDDLYFCIVVI